MLRYLKYDDLNLDEELSKIEMCKEAEIVVDQTNKECLFILGMLFVNGVKIKILNEEDLVLDTQGKSFMMMSYVWNKLGDVNYTGGIHKLDSRILAAKKEGTKVERIVNDPIYNKIFLICPVRNATPEQKRWIEEFVLDKFQDNYIVHAPHLHTNQVDPLGGYNICKENANALATSNEIDLYYDQTSTGSVFDLGVAYALNKPLKLLNKEDIVFNNEDFMDNIIKNWPYNEEELKLTHKQKDFL